MKVYSIGRENGCDIVINDNSDVISRRHATLNVTSSGKMTIVDLSQNGTYVNGIRISQNVPVPVTRKDTVSFAHVSKLDWNLIPKSNSIAMYVAIGVVAVLLVIGGVWGYKSFSGNEEPKDLTTVVTDSLNNKKDSIPQNDNKKDQKKETKPTKSDKGNKGAKTCVTCKKKISDCPYKGKHPKTCKTCGKTIKDCQYKGKHPQEQAPTKFR